MTLKIFLMTSKLSFVFLLNHKRLVNLLRVLDDFPRLNSVHVSLYDCQNLSLSKAIE